VRKSWERGQEAEKSSSRSIRPPNYSMPATPPRAKDIIKQDRRPPITAS